VGTGIYIFKNFQYKKFKQFLFQATSRTPGPRTECPIQTSFQIVSF